MTPEQYQTARASYNYVPARLVHCLQAEAPIEVMGRYLGVDAPSAWPNLEPNTGSIRSSLALDTFHRTLLNGDQDEDLLHGLLSVYFWGFASGTDGRLRLRRALNRTRWLVVGKAGAAAQPAADIAEHIRTARLLLRSDDIAEALGAVMRIKHLGLSFASKVLAFMNPDIAVVYDAVIAMRLKDEASPLQTMYASPKPATSAAERRQQAETYAGWCRWCTSTANELNAIGSTWRDWDGGVAVWRAIDVERAYFALGRPNATPSSNISRTT